MDAGGLPGGEPGASAFFSTGRQRVPGPGEDATAPAPLARSVADTGGHPTLLDSAMAPWPAASPVPAQPPPTPPGRRVRRLRRSGYAVIGTGLALLGVLFISIAAGALSPADLGLGGLGGISQGKAPPAGPAVLTPPSPTPNDPRTPTAAMTAIETEVASALSAGRIQARAASDLSTDIKSIRDRFNRQSDIQRSGQAFLRTVDNQVGDGDLDVSVGAELNRLMDILMRLSDGSQSAG
jgi:hypothetical protein